MSVEENNELIANPTLISHLNSGQNILTTKLTDYNYNITKKERRNSNVTDENERFLNAFHHSVDYYYNQLTDYIQYNNDPNLHAKVEYNDNNVKTNKKKNSKLPKFIKSQLDYDISNSYWKKRVQTIFVDTLYGTNKNDMEMLTDLLDYPPPNYDHTENKTRDRDFMNNKYTFLTTPKHKSCVLYQKEVSR